MLYLISNKFSENELEPIYGKVEKLIKDNGGTITFSQAWGKKKLAYPIAGFRHGYYYLLEFDILGDKVALVDRAMGLAPEILRQQIVKKKVKKAEEIEADKKIAEKIASKAREKLDKAKKEEVKEKVDLKELDEKLDKILETEDLL